MYTCDEQYEHLTNLVPASNVTGAAHFGHLIEAKLPTSHRWSLVSYGLPALWAELGARRHVRAAARALLGAHGGAAGRAELRALVHLSVAFRARDCRRPELAPARRAELVGLRVRGAALRAVDRRGG